MNSSRLAVVKVSGATIRPLFGFCPSAPRTASMSAVLRTKLVIGSTPAQVDLDVAGLRPSELPQALHESRDPRLPLGIAFGSVHQHRDAARAVALLGARRKRLKERAPSRHAAEQRNELAAPHDD